MITNDKFNITEFDFEKINGKVSPYKEFRSFHYPNGKPALCQIKKCKEKASWLIEFEDKGRVFCFKHGEDLKPIKI